MKSNSGKARSGIIDATAVLLMAAKEDRSFGNRLRVVLRLPSFQRKSMINTAVTEMQIKGEPPLLIQAIAVLADDASADKMLRYLEE